VTGARGPRIVVVAACLAAAAVQTAAASGTVEIVVRVRSDGRIVSDGFCRLTSSVVRRQARIGPDGTSRFENVESGTYELSCAQDARRGTRELRVDDDAATITVPLSLALVRIGETRAVAAPRSVADPVIVSRGAPLGRLSRSLYDALNALGGARVVVGSSGELTGISLEGQDPRLTEYSFDGARLSDPGAIRAIPDDVLQSISVEDGRRQVDLYTLAPTAYPEYWARQRYGGFGGNALQIGARGAVGSTGFVVQASQSGARSPLDGTRYRDLSGLDYVHEGWARGANVLAKAAVPVGPVFTMTLESLRGDTIGRPIDATWLGAVPDGIGPGSRTASRSSVDRLELEGDSRQWHLRGDLGVYGTHDLTDDAARVVALQSVPLSVANAFRLATVDASAVDSLAEGKTLNLGVSASRSRTTVRTVVGGSESAFSDQSSLAASDMRAVASYVLKRGKSDTTTVSLQGESRGSEASGAYVDAVGTYGVGASRVFARLGYGTRPVPRGAPVTFSDPAAAQYDCSTGQIVVRGPNENAVPVAESHVSIGAARDSHNASLSAQIYRTTDDGLTLSNALGYLPGYPGALPPSYASQLLSGYQAFGGCAAGPPPPIFVQHDVAGLGVEYRGMDLLSAWKANTGLTLQGALHVHEALLRRSPQELEASSTAYVLGRQLPAIPLFDASLTVDWALGDHKTELIGNAAYTAGNNADHLPPYSLLTLGATRRLSATTALTLVATNVTHEYVGLFTSNQHAVALPTAVGLPLLLPATPLVQPQVFLIVESRISRQH
jgi:hypothetical protein